MGLWFFLSIAVAGHFVFKVYKMRMDYRNNIGHIKRLEHEIDLLKKQQHQGDFAERLERLEETVYLSDFELKRQFKKLESEVSSGP